MKTTRKASVPNKSRERGFSLIEVVCSMFILTIGLVSLLGVFALSMKTTQTAQQDIIAKQLANEAMESIFTARNTAQVQWLQIQNVGAGTNPDGIFQTGMQPINNSGTDGIFGTVDDSTAGGQILYPPGSDGLPSTAHPMPLTTYQRSVQITPVIRAGLPLSTLRTLRITVQYNTAQYSTPKTYVLTGFISQYR